jgi:hypothetical protein
MGNSNRDSIEHEIEAWIRANVAFPDVQLHGRCTKIVLKQLNLERKPQADVASFPVRLDPGAENEFDPLLHSISNAAQQDANDMNQGVQVYAIYAYYQNDPTYVARKIFRVASDTDVDRDLTPSEPPTEKGLVAQTMRHLEAVMKTNTVTMGYMMNAQQAEIRRQAEMIEAYSKQQTDFVVILQDTLNDQQKRRLEERKQEMEMAIKDELMSKLGTLLPYFVNRLAGTPIFPEQDRMLIMFGTFLERLSDDQQRSFMKSLDENQQLAFAAILEEYEKKKKTLEKQPVAMEGKFNKNQLPESSVSSSAKTKQDAKQADAPGTTKQIEAIKGDDDDLLVPEDQVQQIPLFMSLKDRLKSQKNQRSSDPRTVELEDKVAAFTSKFRDMLSKPPSKPE